MKYETEEQILQRIAGNAGGVLDMFKAVFQTPDGIDVRSALIFTSALAGYACHQAVKAVGGQFAVVTTKAGKRFYFGDDVNRYLLEDQLSVASLCVAVSGISEEEILSIVSDFAAHVGDDPYTICGYDPGSLYEQVDSCWKGIYENMTSKYCSSPKEWPVLFGIVVQNILLMAIEVGAPEDEAGKIAIECAAAMSKMDRDSF